MKPSLEQKVLGGFALALSAIALIAFISYLLAWPFADLSQWVSHTREVLAGLEEVSNQVKDAERGQRDYIITGDEQSLELYYSAIGGIEPGLDRLRDLTRDNPRQQQRVIALKQRAAQTLAHLRTTIALREHQGYEAAKQRALSGAPRAGIKEIEQIIKEMKEEEDRLLALRLQSARSSRRKTIAISSIFISALLASVYFFNKRERGKRRLAKETELERARQQALELAQLKSELLANMSHEVRTPLNGVIGLTELLLHTELTPQQREYVERAQKAGETLLTIISDILDCSRIEAGKMRLEMIDFDLRDVVGEVAESLARRAQAKGLEVACLIQPDVPHILRGDPHRLRQVLINLTSNAVKFTRQGQVSLRAKLAEQTDTVTTIRFEVSDTGIGIAPEARARLFQTFSQADSSSTRKFGGAGLGLAISRQLVELMGGEIGAESEPGQGSTFWFTARLSHIEGAPARLSSEPRETAPFNNWPTLEDAPLKDGCRVLVVEDNEVNQMASAKMLEQLGFQADVAINGREAIEAYQQKVYDLVLMDCQMPEMDGFAATQTIRQIEAACGTVRVPIVAVTAHAMPGDREKCLAAGMDDYLAKPVKLADLSAMLWRWTKREPKPPRPEAAAVTAQSNGVVDAAVIESFRAHGQGEAPEFLAKLIGQFLQDTASRLTALRQAAALADVQALKQTAHSLKGSSGVMGARTMAVLCLELEDCARSGRLNETSTLLDQLEEEFSGVKAAMEAELQR